MATYDGFISYKRSADERLAKSIQRGLQRFARPWYKPSSYLSIFRDAEVLTPSADLGKTIESSLRSSAYMIVLLSKAAAESRWVNKEIEYWLSVKSKESIIPVIAGSDSQHFQDIDGEIAWADILPPALRSVFQEPLAVDMRGWNRSSPEDSLTLKNENFREKIAEIAAAIEGKNKSELIGLENAARVRARVVSRSIGLGALILLGSLVLSGLGWLTSLRAQGAAEEAAIVAEERRSEANQAREDAESATAVALRAGEEARELQSQAETAADAAQVLAQQAGDEQAVAEEAQRSAETARSLAEEARQAADVARSQAEIGRQIAEDDAAVQLAIGSVERLANSSSSSLATATGLSALLAGESLLLSSALPESARRDDSEFIFGARRSAVESALNVFQDPPTGRIVTVLRGHPSPLTDLEFESETILRSEDVAGNLVRWDISSGDIISGSLDLSFDLNSAYGLACGQTGRLGEFPTGSIRFESELREIDVLLNDGESGLAQVVDADSGTPIGSQLQYDGSCLARWGSHPRGLLALSTTNVRIVGNDNLATVGEVEIVVWDLSGRSPTDDIEGWPEGSVVVRSDDGRTSAVTSPDNQITIFDEFGQAVGGPWSSSGSVVAVDRSGEYLVLFSQDCQLSLHDATTGAVVSVLDVRFPLAVSCSEPTDIDVSISRARLAAPGTITATPDPSSYAAQIWDGATGEDIADGDLFFPNAPGEDDIAVGVPVFEGGFEYTTAAAFSPDGGRLAWGTDNDSVVLFDVSGAKVDRSAAERLDVGLGVILDMKWIDGSSLIVGGSSGTAVIDVESGVVTARVPIPGGPLGFVSEGGLDILAIGQGHAVRLWSLNDGSSIGGAYKMPFAVDRVWFTTTNRGLELRAAAGVETSGWVLNHQEWIDQLCLVANRPMTTAEAGESLISSAPLINDYCVFE